MWRESEEVCPRCGQPTEEEIVEWGGVEYIEGERCVMCGWFIDLTTERSEGDE